MGVTGAALHGEPDWRAVQRTDSGKKAAIPGPLDDLIGHSITYRIAVGPRAGQKLFTLQTLPARDDVDQRGEHFGAASAGGFSLHASIDIQPQQR